MSVKAAFLVALGFLALAAMPARAQFADQAPGQRFQIDPTHLARPYATDSAGKRVNLAYNAETLKKLDNAEAGEN